MTKSLEQLDQSIYARLDQAAWHQALLMAMSDIPSADQYGTDKPGSYASPCNEFMEANESDGWPEGFIVWQPFENWALCGVQGLVEDMHDSLINFARQTLIITKVINDE